MTTRDLFDPGFVPGRRHVSELLDHLAGEKVEAEAASRALSRVEAPLAEILAERLRAATGPLRARLIRLAARRLDREDALAVMSMLRDALVDPDPSVRRAAARGLGRTSGGDVEAELARALSSETDPSARRAVIEALGKVGGAPALEALERLPTGGSPETDRVRSVALARSKRSTTRGSTSWATAAKLSPRRTWVLRCRPGLGELLANEARDRLGRVPIEARADAIEIAWAGSLDALFALRIWTEVAFPLAPRELRRGESVAAAGAELLSSREALAVLRTLTTSSPARYRLEWSGEGKRRRATQELAEELARRSPAVINDPKSAPWLVRVRLDRDLLRAELVPHPPDPRFSYRQRDVPAASHPTVAAAITRLAAPRRDDVVWDPFVGSGLELCECHLMAEPRVLLGSDTDERALDAARENATAAGAGQAKLRLGDALDVRLPEAPTLIITNPPLGRRVGSTEEVTRLLVRFVTRAAALLAPGGRLVWMTPRPRATDPAAQRAGLEIVSSVRVDLGGVSAWLQRLQKGKPS